MATKAKLVIFDLDGTISKRDTFKEILILGLAFRPHRIALIPLSVYDFMLYLTGIYTNSLVKERLLKRVFGGLTKKKLNLIVTLYKAFFAKKNVHTEAMRVIKIHQENNDSVILISASFDFYVKAIVSDIGFDKVICTRAETKEGRLTGLIDGQNCYSRRKVEELRYQFNLSDYSSIVCYTDHHSDLPLIDVCDFSYLVNPTKKLKVLLKEIEQFKVIKWD